MMKKINKHSRKYKQEQLLNDDNLINKVQNAPVTKIFTIDVGNISPNKIQNILTRIKHKIEYMRKI